MKLVWINLFEKERYSTACFSFSSLLEIGMNMLMNNSKSKKVVGFIIKLLETALLILCCEYF